MNKSKIFFIVPLIIFLFFISCTVVKDDIYLQQKKQNRKLGKLEFVERQNNEVISIVNNNRSLPELSYGLNKTLTDIQPEFLASISNVYIPLENRFQLIPFDHSTKPFNIMPVLNDSDTCDIILKRDGEKIQAKVIEVGEDVIKYKICDFLTGPTYSISKDNITMITYSNGRTDVFKKQNNQTTTESQKEVIGVTGMILAILCYPIMAILYSNILILGLLFNLFISIVLMADARKKIRIIDANRDKYTGQGFLVATIVLGAILLASGIIAGIIML